ncbi:MAG TPA: pyridoxine 5'-phosphate synthase [Elusimicrobiota bacterium]|nr:pyridoxine 5'-phosphate synthase [Elusimicrobiota bacterium]
MPLLGVNIDHVATLRQARRVNVPDIQAAAEAAIAGGADNITVHLREDRRHIQDHDVAQLRKNLKVRLNLEMAVTEEMIRVARLVIPHNVCLVPEQRQELTTESGLDVQAQVSRLRSATKKIKSKGIIVSLFVDPDPVQIQAAKQAGADAVEIHTGAYANAKDAVGRALELERIQSAAQLARDLGLILNAGHGLNYENVRSIAQISGMNELNIGFSILARAVFVGLEPAVREMKKLINGPAAREE